MKRRFLSLLLVLAMVLPMVPVVGSADTGSADSLSAQVEQIGNQVRVRIDYRIPDRTFTAGKSYYFVAAAYDTDEKLVGSGYNQRYLDQPDGYLSLPLSSDLPEDYGVCVYLLDEGYVPLCDPVWAS